MPRISVQYRSWSRSEEKATSATRKISRVFKKSLQKRVQFSEWLLDRWLWHRSLKWEMAAYSSLAGTTRGWSVNILILLRIIHRAPQKTHKILFSLNVLRMWPPGNSWHFKAQWYSIMYLVFSFQWWCEICLRHTLTEVVTASETTSSSKRKPRGSPRRLPEPLFSQSTAIPLVNMSDNAGN